MTIATCNNVFENMTLFNGDHEKPKISGTVNGKNFLWIIDTGSAVTYMNPNAYEAAFRQMPKAKLKDLQTDIFYQTNEIHAYSANC